jgi:hypothetical protein
MTASYDELNDAGDRVMDVFTKEYPNFTPPDIHFVLSIVCAEILRQFPLPKPDDGDTVPNWRKDERAE